MSERHGRSGLTTANIAKPSKQWAVSPRVLAALALLIALPALGLLLPWRGVKVALALVAPGIGLLFIWWQGVFYARGRMLLTTLATLAMAVCFVQLTPHQELAVQRPIPAPPAAVTPAPEGENLTALYNIEELIYEQQLAQVLESGGTEQDLLTEEQKLDAVNAENERIMEITVYSVYNGAKYYHSERICRNQTNGRELTIREAMREGLAPCPNCNPPVISN